MLSDGFTTKLPKGNFSLHCPALKNKKADYDTLNNKPMLLYSLVNTSKFFDSRSADLFKLSRSSVYVINETAIPFETQDVTTRAWAGRSLLLHKIRDTTESCLTHLRTSTTAFRPDLRVF